MKKHIHWIEKLAIVCLLGLSINAGLWQLNSSVAYGSDTTSGGTSDSSDVPGHRIGGGTRLSRTR